MNTFFHTETMMKRVIILAIVLFAQSYWLIALEWTIGDINETSASDGDHLPITTSTDYSYAQIFYPNDVMPNHSITITGISFYYQGGASLANDQRWNILLGSTDQMFYNSNLTQGSWIYQDGSSFPNLQHYGNIPDFTSTDPRWIDLTITPFRYNNGDNFLVVVNEDMAGSSGNGMFHMTEYNTTVAKYAARDGSAFSSQAYGSYPANGYSTCHPTIKLTYEVFYNPIKTASAYIVGSDVHLEVEVPYVADAAIIPNLVIMRSDNDIPISVYDAEIDDEQISVTDPNLADGDYIYTLTLDYGDSHESIEYQVFASVKTITTFPYTEDFNETQEAELTQFNSTGYVYTEYKEYISGWSGMNKWYDDTDEEWNIYYGLNWWFDDYISGDEVDGKAFYSMFFSENDHLITPSIVLQSGAEYTLDFDLDVGIAPDGDALAETAVFAVLVSTDNGVTFDMANALKVWRTVPGDGENSLADLEGLHRISLPITGFSGKVKIAFFTDRAFDVYDGFSFYLDNLSITEEAPLYTLNPPRTLTATAGDTEITLSWLAPEVDETPDTPALYGYTIYDADGDTEVRTQAHVADVATQTYTVSGLTNGTLYEYYVKALYGDTSPYLESVATATASATPYALNPPLTLSAIAGDTQIVLNWLVPEPDDTPGAPALYGYTIYDADDDSEVHTQAHVADVATQTYTVTGLTNGTLYDYYVTALYGVATPYLESEATDTASATPFAPIPTFTISGTVKWGVAQVPQIGADITFTNTVTPSASPDMVTSVSPGEYTIPAIQAGIYNVRVAGTNPSGEEYTFDFIGEDAIEITGASTSVNLHVQPTLDDADVFALPIVTSLKTNYPNPFNPSTTIAFEMASEGYVSIDVFNVKGQKVKSLANDVYRAGRHNVVWNGEDASGRAVGSGVYFYRMTAQGYISVQKMLMMK